MKDLAYNQTDYGMFENMTSDKTMQCFKEAIAELEAMQHTRREWYQKGYNEAMKPKSCEWQYNEFDEAWSGKCGIKFQIAFDTPKANNMNFCPQCGGKIIEIDPKETKC